MDREVIIEKIALRSAQWDSDERLKFIWKNNLVVGNYDRDRKIFQVITHVGEDDANQIKDWFYRMTHQGKLGEETEEDVQENWD